jgi:hypothetical protein
MRNIFALSCRFGTSTITTYETQIARQVLKQLHVAWDKCRYVLYENSHYIQCGENADTFLI